MLASSHDSDTSYKSILLRGSGSSRRAQFVGKKLKSLPPYITLKSLNTNFNTQEFMLSIQSIVRTISLCFYPLWHYILHTYPNVVPR